MEYLKYAWLNKRDWSGVTDRKNYWMWALISWGSWMVLALPIFILAATIVFLLPVLVLISIWTWLELSMQVRRMRDAGFNPWLLLLVLVPFGAIAVIVLLAQPTKTTMSKQ